MKEPKEFDYFKAWLMFFLIATVGGGILGLIIGSFLAAFFFGAGGMPLAQMTRILQVVGFIIAMPISYVTFRAESSRGLSPAMRQRLPGGEDRAIGFCADFAPSSA
jgi:hypothetical protein